MTAQDTAWRERGHRFCSRQQFDWIWDAASESKQHTDRETLVGALRSALTKHEKNGITDLFAVADAILAAPSLSLVAARRDFAEKASAHMRANGHGFTRRIDMELLYDALFASGILKPSSEVEAAALARAWERGIHDLHEHKLIYDAWRYNYRDHPGDGPTNPHSGEVFHRTAVQHRPDWWVNPYPADADSTIEAARVRSGKDE